MQLQKDMCAILCVQTQAAGAPALTSVLPVGTTAATAHVWEAAAFCLGQRFWVDVYVIAAQMCAFSKVAHAL